jgi:hypothetical protein
MSHSPSNTNSHSSTRPSHKPRSLLTLGPRVVHCKHSPYDVYIGRPGPWGNPFIIGQHGDREQVINKYRQMIINDKQLYERAQKELKGKVLACWCSPLPCHGDALVEIANKTEETQRKTEEQKEIQQENKAIEEPVEAVTEGEEVKLSAAQKRRLREKRRKEALQQ